MLFEIIEESRLLLMIPLTAAFRKLAEKLFLIAVQILGNLDNYRYHKVTLTIGIVYVGNTSATESESSIGLCSFGDGILFLTVKSGNIDIRTEDCLCKSDRYFAVHVSAVTLEDLVSLYGHYDDKVTCRAAVSAVTALTAECDLLTVVDSCGDLHVKLLRDLRITCTAASLTRILDYLTGTTALVTGTGGLDHSERGTLGDSHLTGTAALGTGFDALALMSTGTAAVTALLNFLI